MNFYEMVSLSSTSHKTHPVIKEGSSLAQTDKKQTNQPTKKQTNQTIWMLKRRETVLSFSLYFFFYSSYDS